MNDVLTAPSTSVFRLRRPDPGMIATLAAASADLPFSYEAVGGTRGGGPPGFRVDRHVDVVGRGQADFDRLVAAMHRWTMFDLSWVELLDPSAPIAPGQVAAFASHQLGLWMVNICRVVYVIDERDGPIWRFGFAYGTLPGHAVAGEELFLATWDTATDEVRFAIDKFSRARHPLVRLAGPIGRAIQDRFSVEAIARMARAVAEAR